MTERVTVTGRRHTVTIYHYLQGPTHIGIGFDGQPPYGHYPKEPMTGLIAPAPGVWVKDSVRGMDSSKAKTFTFEVSEDAYQRMLAYLNHHANDNYDLMTMNCTDHVTGALRAGGIPLVTQPVPVYAFAEIKYVIITGRPVPPAETLLLPRINR
jgi:hypothetical protein